MRVGFSVLLGAALFGLPAIEANARNLTLTVGPGGQYRTLSSAAAAANADTNADNYYIIDVAPGIYADDFPVVTRPMTIEADPRHVGKQVLLNATIPLPGKKGIIVTTASLTIDGLTFQGASIANSDGGNGAGIRDQNTGSPASLIVRNSLFVGNQEGILTGGNPAQNITISNSRFINNGNPDPQYFQHALYVNRGGSLTVSDSLFCGQLIGHDIKSRALVTTVQNSRIYDGATADPADGCRAGSTSFAIDLPNGGRATISRNLIVQGTATQNNKMVAYGEEGLAFNDNQLLVSGNVFRNTAPNSTAIYSPPPCRVKAQLSQNTFIGVATPVSLADCAIYK